MERAAPLRACEEAAEAVATRNMGTARAFIEPAALRRSLPGALPPSAQADIVRFADVHVVLEEVDNREVLWVIVHRDHCSSEPHEKRRINEQIGAERDTGVLMDAILTLVRLFGVGRFHQEEGQVIV